MDHLVMYVCRICFDPSATFWFQGIWSCLPPKESTNDQKTEGIVQAQTKKIPS